MGRFRNALRRDALIWRRRASSFSAGQRIHALSKLCARHCTLLRHAQRPKSMPAGRPPDYTEALAEEICLRLAEGESLVSMCREEGMPGRATVFRWPEKHEAFPSSLRFTRWPHSFLLSCFPHLISSSTRAVSPIAFRNPQFQLRFVPLCLCAFV